MTVATLSPKLLVRRSDHRFYIGMGVFLLVLVFLGFWPTYFQPILNASYDGNVIVRVHALVFLTWMFLYLLQTSLVARRKTPVHKKVGNWGMILGGLMFIQGVVVSILLIKRLMEAGTIDSVGAGIWRASEPFLDIIQFAVLIVFGYLSRKDPPKHRRYMLLTTIAIMPPATARMGYLLGPWCMEIWFTVFFALIFWHDWRVHGKISKVNVVGFLILLPRAILATGLKF